MNLVKRFPKQISSQNDSLYLIFSSSPTERLVNLKCSTYAPNERTVIVEVVVLGPAVPVVLVLIVEAGAPEHGPPPTSLLGLHLPPRYFDTQDYQSEYQELCWCLHVIIMDTGPAMI